MNIIVSLIKSQLFISLSISFLIMGFLPLILNYTILTNFPNIAIFLIPIISFINTGCVFYGNKSTCFSKEKV